MSQVKSCRLLCPGGPPRQVIRRSLTCLDGVGATTMHSDLSQCQPFRIPRVLSPRRREGQRYLWKWRRWFALLPTGSPGVQVCASPCGLVQPYIGPQVVMCAASSIPCLCTDCAHLQVAGHVSGSPSFACLLVGTRLGSRCRGKGLES